MILIAIANDAENLEDIQNRISAIGAIKCIAEVHNIVPPKNTLQFPGWGMKLITQLEPVLKQINQKSGSRYSFLMFEEELQISPTT